MLERIVCLERVRLLTHVAPVLARVRCALRDQKWSDALWHLDELERALRAF